MVAGPDLAAAPTSRARRPRPAASRTTTLAKRAAALGAAGLLAVTTVALATGDPTGANGAGNGLRVGSGSGVAAPPAVTPPASEPAATPSGTGGATTPRSGTGSAGPGSGSSPGGAAPGSPGGGSPPGTPPSPGGLPDDDVAVVSPVLSVFAFGSQIGMPLVCSVAAGAVGPAITDPALSAVVGEIVATCAEYGNEGANALRQLDANLAGLAALNPAVQPVLEQLTTSLEAAASSNAPFARSLGELIVLLRFFAG